MNAVMSSNTGRTHRSCWAMGPHPSTYAKVQVCIHSIS
jgi:hypothetical protein